MEDLIVKNVDVMGDSIMATQDEKGCIWAGVSYFCKALGMSNAQRDTQVEKVQSDKTLKRGTRKFPGGVFDPNNEAVAIKVDFVPLWLAKIQITKKMEQDHPDLADKLLNYQLKAKDILAAAFLPKQSGESGDLRKQIQVIAQGTDELYQKVDAVTEDVKSVRQEIETLKDDLPLFPSEADEVKNAINRKVVSLLGGKDSNAYRNNSLAKKIFIDCYRTVKHNFGDINTYKALKRGQKERALQVIEEYKPPVFLAEQIETANAQQRLDV